MNDKSVASHLRTHDMLLNPMKQKPLVCIISGLIIFRLFRGSGIPILESVWLDKNVHIYIYMYIYSIHFIFPEENIFKCIYLLNVLELFKL